MLIRFLAKRVAILAAACVVTSLFISKLGVMTAFGVLIGAFLALYKVKMFGSFLNGLVNSENIGKKPVFYQIFSQLFLFGVLTASIIANLTFFFGVVAGLLLVPFYICINAVTEKVKITHNNWGDNEELILWKK